MQALEKKISIYQFKIKTLKSVLLDKKEKGGSVVLDKQINKIIENLNEVDFLFNNAHKVKDELLSYEGDLNEYFDYIDQMERFIIV